MENSKQLATRFREVIKDGKWIANTNLKEQLRDVTIDMAKSKISDLNTIAALTFHINYYIAGVLNVFKGGELEIRDKYSFDPPNLNSEQDWKELVEELMSNAEEFAQYVEEMTDEKLEEDFVNAKYGSFRRNIEGMIEHTYYHLGQITLIKKLLERV